MEHIFNDLRRDERVRPRLVEALSQIVGEEANGLSDNDDLGDVLDSMAHFAFLLTLEETFSIEIADERFNFTEMGTIAGIVAVVAMSPPRS